jgi:hypothetical protein
MTVAELQRRWKGCRGDVACQNALVTLFQGGGGTVAEAPGGKVFTDQFGGKVFIPNA